MKTGICTNCQKPIQWQTMKDGRMIPQNIGTNITHGCRHKILGEHRIVGSGKPIDKTRALRFPSESRRYTTTLK